MTELLDRGDEVTTVSGHDRWATVLQLCADATPVTRPLTATRTYNMLRWLLEYRNAYAHVGREAPVPVPGQMYIIVDDDVPVLPLSGARALHARDWRALVGAAEPDDSEPVEHPGTVALRELEGWLGMGLDAIVQLAGLSPSARAFWRDRPDAPIRPSKAGKLLRLRNAVGLLVGEQGVEHAQAMLRGEGWLTEPFNEDRLVRLEVRVRQFLLPDGLQPPAYLAEGGMSREELRTRVLRDSEDEDTQRAAESAAITAIGGLHAPKET